jgi:hypothetical protein
MMPVNCLAYICYGHILEWIFSINDLHEEFSEFFTSPPQYFDVTSAVGLHLLLEIDGVLRAIPCLIFCCFRAAIARTTNIHVNVKILLHYYLLFFFVYTEF